MHIVPFDRKMPCIVGVPRDNRYANERVDRGGEGESKKKKSRKGGIDPFYILGAREKAGLKNDAKSINLIIVNTGTAAERRAFHNRTRTKGLHRA